MNQNLWKLAFLSPAAIAAACLLAVGAEAAPDEPESSSESTSESFEIADSLVRDRGTINGVFDYAEDSVTRPLSQNVRSVSELTDISPTDWAFQAVRNLVERYQCIDGYPDRTFRGDRPLTRYEFAAALNKCLNRIIEIVGDPSLIDPGDLGSIGRLQEEFRAELTTLRGRVDGLEARLADVEANQFSTTTKLVGEAVFTIADNFGDGDDDNTVFQQRVRLNFDTSFFGSDLLRTRLQVGNTGSTTFSGDDVPFGVGANGALTTDFTGDTGNTFLLDTLGYFFPIGENVTGIVLANAGIFDDIAPTMNPALEDFEGGNTTLSLFGQRNPVYRIGGGAGGGLQAQFGPINVSLGYLADSGGDPSEGAGLFNGDYAALGQLAFLPEEGNFGLAATYVRGFHTEGNEIFDNAFGTNLVGTGAVGLLSDVGALETNTVGVQGFFNLGDSLTVSAWGGYTDVELSGADADEEIWNYALTVGVRDVGSEGSLLGLVAGVPPYVGGLSATGDIPIHVEGFYKYQINDNINITPGVVFVANPGQGDDDDDLVIGVIRSTFNF